MPRPSVFPAQHVQHAPPASTRVARKLAFACAFGALLSLSGCYYYPYGYGYGGYPSYYGTVPASSTQQETAVGQPGTAPNPAPNAVPDAQYPGPLYPSPPVAVAVPPYSAWPAYPAYYPYPAWGWGAPAVSFGFGYWGGGGRWR